MLRAVALAAALAAAAAGAAPRPRFPSTARAMRAAAAAAARAPRDAAEPELGYVWEELFWPASVDNFNFMGGGAAGINAGTFPQRYLLNGTWATQPHAPIFL
jgi:hypothetical protein